MKNVRARNFHIIAYNDLESNLNFDLLIKLLGHKQETLDRVSYIMHDCDMTDDGLPKKDHYHINVCFYNQKSLNCLCKFLGLNHEQIKPISNIVSMDRYLIHKDDFDKYQYNVADVHHCYAHMCSIRDFQEHILEDKKRTGEDFITLLLAEIDQYLDLIDGSEVVGTSLYEHLLRWAIQVKRVDEFKRYNGIIRTLIGR